MADARPMSTWTIERVSRPSGCPRAPAARARRRAAAAAARPARDTATLWPRAELPTEAEVLDGLAAKVEHWDRHGFGMWLLRDRETGEMVGRGGLQYTYTAGLNDVEAGWAIVPERWGRASPPSWLTPASRWRSAQLGLLEIVAFTLPDNLASRRVMEKVGFVYERDIVHVGLPHVLYRRRR